MIIKMETGLTVAERIYALLHFRAIVGIVAFIGIMLLAFEVSTGGTMGTRI